MTSPLSQLPISCRTSGFVQHALGRQLCATAPKFSWRSAVGMGSPWPLLLLVGCWASPFPSPPRLCTALFVLLCLCSCFNALIESSLEEKLNRVCGGMLVMPDLLFGVFLGGHLSLRRGCALANWMLTVASLRGYSCWVSSVPLSL